MAASKKDSERVQQGEQSGPPVADDLIDFFRRWSDFRPTVAALADRTDLSLLERQTVQWLMQLADRVSERDLQPVRRP